MIYATKLHNFKQFRKRLRAFFTIILLIFINYCVSLQRKRRKNE